MSILPVIVDGLRTPLSPAGQGPLAKLRSETLAAWSIDQLLARKGVDAKLIDELFLAQGVDSPADFAGIGRTVSMISSLAGRAPGLSLTRGEIAGLDALLQSHIYVQNGQGKAAIAAGCDQLSRQAYSSPSPLYSAILNNCSAHAGPHLFNETLAERLGLSRDQLDAATLHSYQQSSSSLHEWVAVMKKCIPDMSWEETTVTGDGSLSKQKRSLGFDPLSKRNISREQLVQLPPSIKRNGISTHAHTSTPCDGSAALLIMDGELAASLNLEPIGRLHCCKIFSTSDPKEHLISARAAHAALSESGLQLADMDIFMVGESSAAIPAALVRELPIPIEKLNPMGGALSRGWCPGGAGIELAIDALHFLRARSEVYAMIILESRHGIGAVGILEAFAS